MCLFVYNIAIFIYISLIRWRVIHNNVHKGKFHQKELTIQIALSLGTTCFMCVV